MRNNNWIVKLNEIIGCLGIAFWVFMLASTAGVELYHEHKTSLIVVLCVLPIAIAGVKHIEYLALQKRGREIGHSNNPKYKQ